MSKDVYKLVTDRIIEALEAGIVPWNRPWKTGVGNNGPRSLASGKPYRGVNVWILAATAALRGYDSSYWATFKQVKERGGTVRKGEKGTQIVLWKPVKAREAEGGEEQRRDYLLLRYFTVFNIEQCDGIEEPAGAELPEVDPIESAQVISDRYIAHNGPSLGHGGDRAYYAPALDRVQMPLIEAFDSAEHYYGTLFHELAHSTAHESRLNRPIAESTFGSEDYSREELIAEMAAAFLCGEAGIEVNIEHHAGYLASWLQVLNNDRKLIVQAAAAAQKATDRVLGSEYGKDVADPTPKEGSGSERPAPTHTQEERHDQRQRLRLERPSSQVRRSAVRRGDGGRACRQGGRASRPPAGRLLRQQRV
jgi:antirestriction protein ArdC